MKTLLTLFVVGVVFNLALVSVASASTDGEKTAARAAKMRAELQKLGTGKDARIEVKLADGTKLKGYVSEVWDGSFVIVSDSTNAPVEVPYPQAKKVKGHNLSTGVKIAIAAGLVLLVILILAATKGS